ncbi:TatD family hydrolase [Limosilactobacillus sp. STM2_1]|uniref:TatD family hydrolase n=1 Tax=Limosilactobacillus rudii TaxID=2759755 RepID=A0A7W3YP17_9LACO|nr:TatD family hydrolase [Limosilactobacillus rudii]MBB1079019.1 TatD family hydrolase [Limosilactobacillus rudii]MBB1098295.1 TatD family hydrolase [Limosilactobacillus rudii]MCD7135303.1 TatD family hydrolase [Limosilactobacillus rudii]
MNNVKEKHQGQIYDSHTHLNDDAFYDDVPAFIDRAAHYGVTEMNIVGSNRELNQRALKLGHRYDNLHPIIGWHPEDIAGWNESTKRELQQQLRDPLVVGIGEIGLDYYNDDHSPHQQQQDIFMEQLIWARKLHLPVSIHCRDALADTYDILSNAHIDEFGGVMHSFNGSAAWAEKFMALGMMISFSGVVSFKNAIEVHEAAQVVPLEKMMVETDAPYLTPLPYRGKQNEPGFTKFTVDTIAALKQVDAGKVAYKTFENARRLFLQNEERGL